MTKYEKLNISLRYWLLGVSSIDKEYIKCLEAMEFASKFHIGYRKDGITNEFEHQLVIVHYLRTLISNLNNPPDTICTAFLHDVPEDYDIGFDEISNKFGTNVANSTEKLTKIFRGTKKNIDDYFKSISEDENASVVKGSDRIHNLQSMNGVFTDEKKKIYIKEAEDYIIPCLKISRRNFPTQELAYENIKLIMLSQIDLLKFTLNT